MSDQLLQQLENKKNALVLSGGVVKAATWHLGVAMALEELGVLFCNNQTINQEHPIKVSTYVGSSAGALICTYLAMGIGPNKVIEAQLGQGGDSSIAPVTYKHMLAFNNPLKFKTLTKYANPFEHFPTVFKTLLRPIQNINGLFNTTGLKQYLIDEILKQNNFEDLATDLFVVATQLDHSRKVVFSKHEYRPPAHDLSTNFYTGIHIADAVAASMSVPPFYTPYPIFNPVTQQIDYYIDGEIRDTLSSHVAIDHGQENIICSWTHTPYHFKKEIGSLVNYGLPSICAQAIFLLIQRKIDYNRRTHQEYKLLFDSIVQYMDEEKFSKRQKSKIVELLEDKFGHKLGTKFIDINPTPNNHKIFFSSNFSLGKQNTARLVRMGYRRTMEVFGRL